MWLIVFGKHIEHAPELAGQLWELVKGSRWEADRRVARRSLVRGFG